VCVQAPGHAGRLAGIGSLFSSFLGPSTPAAVAPAAAAAVGDPSKPLGAAFVDFLLSELDEDAEVASGESGSGSGEHAAAATGGFVMVHAPGQAPSGAVPVASANIIPNNAAPAPG
jgi:hypothetical protein